MIAKPFLTSTLLCLSAAAFLGAIAPQAAGQGLPAGPGKSDLEMVCTVCHGVDQITANGPRTPREWDGVMAAMTAFGASGSNAQMVHCGIPKDQVQPAAYARRGSGRKGVRAAPRRSRPPNYR